MNTNSATTYELLCYSEQDLCSYAHHVWIQNGMSFDKNPWEEALACLAANLDRCAEPDQPGVQRIATQPHVKATTGNERIRSGHKKSPNQDPSSQHVDGVALIA